MAAVSWTIKHYSRSGSPISAASYSGAVSNTIVHATDRNMNFNLNSVDECNFSLYLDDPVAAQINRLHSHIKVWRNVPGYSDPSNEPVFAGVVGNTVKDGEANIMRVRCFSPFWKLQFRFHLNNHYMKNFPETQERYRQSELIWKFIDFINGAFVGPGVSFTGISRGTFYDRNDEVIISPYFLPRGSNTWTEIFDEVLLRPGSVDLIPRYSHQDGNPRLMFLDTSLKRGQVRGTSFNYHTGEGTSNCSNMTEEQIVKPGEDGFANYIMVVGAGGPNSGKMVRVGKAGDSSTDDGYDNIGPYMKVVNKPNIKRIGVRTPKPTHLYAILDAELKLSSTAEVAYNATVSPVGGIYYGKDFTVGDVVTLNANKGALQISGAQQRIYSCTVSISDNNIETSTPTISHDFYSKVA